MALMITEDCTLCDACVEPCPNEAISKGEPFVIDPMKCSECIGAHDEPQCIEECPSACIIPNPDWEESEEELEAKYEMLHG
jgi:ferredoxin